MVCVLKGWYCVPKDNLCSKIHTWRAETLKLREAVAQRQGGRAKEELSEEEAGPARAYHILPESKGHRLDFEARVSWCCNYEA